jgi:hypothetical protein
MTGKRAWMVGAALAASALMLAGCVAETADDEAPTAQTGAALVIQPELPKQQGGTQGTPPGGASVPSTAPAENNDEEGTPGSDPEPSPWTPQTTRNH